MFCNTLPLFFKLEIISCYVEAFFLQSRGILVGKPTCSVIPCDSKESFLKKVYFCSFESPSSSTVIESDTDDSSDDETQVLILHGSNGK